ncbi:PH domain-containing protein [Arenimonas sp. MALMAid1274]|uniref:PH domain-containing protein n=1 Tax=Arenimonas sp. MALMAid1274 TaxID=3411630 RepID=UPI003B9EE49B
MTEPDLSTPLPAPEPPVTLPAEWQPLPDAARTVSGIVGAISAVVMGGGAAFLLPLVVDGWPARIGLALLWLAVLALIGTAWGRARWRRTRWRLDERGLQVRRGLVWQSETLVPRTRVQHLDLERGPIERRFGLATLVAHTAGTRMHALRQSGFVDADAVALRDALLPEAARHDDPL